MNNQPVDRATHQLYTKAKGQTVRKHFYCVISIYLSHLYYLLVNLQTLPLKKTFKIDIFLYNMIVYSIWQYIYIININKIHNKSTKNLVSLYTCLICTGHLHQFGLVMIHSHGCYADQHCSVCVCLQTTPHTPPPCLKTPTHSKTMHMVTNTHTGLLRAQSRTCSDKQNHMHTYRQTDRQVNRF